MLSFIKGKVKFREGNFLVVENNGLGYKIFVSAEIFLKAKPEETIELYLHQHVREDALQLFGFEEYEELKLFEQLISISGIGPKTALGVFAEASLADIISAIVNGDASILKKVSGIGNKTAERIVLELKNKITAGTAVNKLKSKEELNTDGDAVEALVSLGYSTGQAKEALNKVSKDVQDVREKVRQALKNLKQ